MKSSTAHKIKHRAVANDEFYTPPALAVDLIGLVPLVYCDEVLDAAYGTGAFYNNYPPYVVKFHTREFEKWARPVDWIVTNPPYSLLGKWWLPHTQSLCRKGYAYLIGQGNLTARRIEQANNAGFGLTKIHLCKVFKWYGMSYFVVFQRGKDNIVSFDRKVWR
jgi:hypothetical protein